MRIVIPSIGSRGDVQPFISLAQGLSRAGHQVILASHPIMKSLVESFGVFFSPIGPDIDLPNKAAEIRHKSRNTMTGLINAMNFGFEMLEKSHDDILALLKGADLVVVPATSAAGKNESEQLGIPYLSVTFMPWAIPWSEPGRPLIKKIAYGMIDGLVSLITTAPLNRIRKKQGLPPVGKEGFTSPRLNLIPVSPQVFPHNPYWESRHHIVGYWFAQTSVDWQPTQDLLDFLKKGEPPLLVSLGAMSLGEVDALETASLFVDAIQQAGGRAIIQGWDSAMQKLNLPDEFLPSGDLPYEWILPQCSGIVHHGGFGTTSAGLAAGIPALVIPHIADQFYWGQKIKDLGVGLPFISRKKLTREILATSLKELIHNEQIHSTAMILGEKIRAEKGIQNAVRLIEDTFQ